LIRINTAILKAGCIELMKVLVILFSLLAIGSGPVSAQSVVQACKDARGEIYYENSRTLKKHCKVVENESVSVIRSSPRAQKLPISIGMSQDQVRNNWGKPIKITKFHSRSGLTEQWEYRAGTLTFANGVLEVIQQ
jgi:hypothetical protein